jgi:hypothetical protein
LGAGKTVCLLARIWRANARAASNRVAAAAAAAAGDFFSADEDAAALVVDAGVSGEGEPLEDTSAAPPAGARSATNPARAGSV